MYFLHFNILMSFLWSFFSLQELDFEVELAFVIGKSGKKIKVSKQMNIFLALEDLFNKRAAWHLELFIFRVTEFFKLVIIII